MLFFVGCADNVGDTLPLITPTLYYKPVIELERMQCPASELRDLVNENDEVLMQLCAKEYNNCLLQGSCFVVTEGKTRAFNFTKNKDGINRFAEKYEARCPYGYGVRAICLDPFYTVAADPTFHQVGDVIFVPKLVGVDLPDSTKHTGYLVVRDVGGAILGENRFDFFTGFYGPYDRANSFSRLGLSDKKNKFGYQKMPEEIAKKVREHRRFPNIPRGSLSSKAILFPLADHKTFSLGL
jgi:3D (Asp-Asp-Asp) domain-containing protein